MNISEKIKTLYQNAFDSIILDASIRNAFKIKKDSVLSESEWQEDTTDNIKIIRKEAVISSCSFSSMISEDGSCSIMGVSLITNRMVEFFITVEGIVALAHTLERHPITKAIKKTKSKTILVPKKLHELQHYIKTTNELNVE